MFTWLRTYISLSVWYEQLHLQIYIIYYNVHTVPLNYNFIFTRVSTRGATKYFACEIPKFPVEICISTRRDVALPRDETWYFHETWYVAFPHDGIVTFTRNVAVLTKLNYRQDSSGL